MLSFIYFTKMLCEQKLYGRSNKSIPPLKFMNFDPMIRSSIPLPCKKKLLMLLPTSTENLKRGT